MFAKLFLKVITFAIVSFLVCLVGVIIAYCFQDAATAGALFQSFIFNFDGILIGAFGYGLLWFIKSTATQVFNSLLNCLEVPDEGKVSILKYSKWITSSKRNHMVSIFVTLIGGMILWNCGYPMHGFSKYYMAATSISLFYVGGMMSGYFIGSILIFRKLDEISTEVKIRNGASSYEIENVSLYLLLSSTVGVIALYLAFRGTITANFTFTNNEFIFRKLLIYPIVSFLPGILFMNFYCRYVLKKIQGNEILQKIDSLELLSKAEISKTTDNKQKLEMEKLFIEIKEKLLVEKNKSPLLSLKDSPAIFVSVIFILEFALKNDSVLKEFFRNIFK